MLLLFCVLVAASPLWESAFEKQPDPVKKSADREYYVVHIADPHEMCAQLEWTLEAPFPITDHWLLSHPLHHTKRSEHALAAGARQVYPGDRSSLHKRMPVPESASDSASNAILAVRTEFGIEDPLFPDQWHIFNPQQPGNDMNVLPVWRRNITGSGITVAIVDDGLEYEHPDFEASFSAEGSYDYNRHEMLPSPLLSDDTHGTRCAGEIAAGKNSVCGVGIAPNAKVAGIRILSGHLTHDDEARSLIHRNNINDIYSCSWGPPDDGKTIDGPPTIVKRAELEGIETGRFGKGSIYVVASGNGDYAGDNCNYDGYTNSIYSITVAAVDRHNQHPYYSESCSANLITTYSSNYFDKITTSDRLDPIDRSTIKCTNQHSGTSAAAPIAAAVFALVLEQRPDLTWRDLQYLARDTGKMFPIPGPEHGAPKLANHDWQITADGHHYHNSYGYGILDADAIVTRAETWSLVKPQGWLFLPPVEAKLPITMETRSTIEVSQSDWDQSGLERIEHVRVRVSYEHERRGIIAFRLTSPAGIVSELAAPRPKDFSSARVENWDFMSVVHWNESGVGVWTLEAVGPDKYQGELSKWQLKLFGELKDSSKAKKFSDEWDQHEPPAAVVRDPFAELDLVSSTDSSAGVSTAAPNPISSADFTNSPSLTSETSAQTPEPTQPTQPAEPTQLAEPTQPAEPSKTPQPAEPVPTDSADNAKGHRWGWSHHTLKYYSLMMGIGLLILSLVAGPVIYFCYLRQRLQSTYDPLSDNVELDDYDDDFEIDGDEDTDVEDFFRGPQAAR